MFQNEDLKNHLDTSTTVRSQSAIIAEWNMNIPTNIFKIGNYRYRPFSTSQEDSLYKNIISTFDQYDQGNFYTGATDADITIDGGYNDSGLPLTLTKKQERLKMFYSLEDCFKPFRPRSGINKATMDDVSGNKYLHHQNPNMAKRPRYYMADKDDAFKYWTSVREEGGKTYGLSFEKNGQYIIEDAAPYVVYNENVPANRIVIKMQTNVGSVDFGTFSGSGVSSLPFTDPFYGYSKQTTPIKWKVQTLKNNSWTDLISFNQNTKRRDGSEIIKHDGYVELSYGLKVPEKYRDIFIFAEKLASETLLPERAVNGYSYLIVNNESEIGTFYIWLDEINNYATFVPEYGWSLEEETVDRLTNFVTDLTSPENFTNPLDSTIKYREFEYLRGIRIVVDTMNGNQCSFDLIEMSPRLTVDLSSKTISYNINKSASDLGVTGLPVGQLLASTGSLNIFDYDGAFNTENENSIIAKYISRNIQFKFYEVVVNVDGYDYFIPIKTMYSEGFPKLNDTDKSVDLDLRDLYFYFESQTAPQILIRNASVSAAVSLLLDSIGFSNYSFKRVDGESELTIPFFYIKPDTSIAEILQDIARSTQTAMFFDEYNNFIMMSKNYIMPSIGERPTDFVLYGSDDMSDTGVIKNKTTKDKIANIIQVTSQNNQVYNDGTITYTTRHIQRSVGSIKQASLIDNERSYIYKPVLLWEVSGTENVKSINNEVGTQSAYMLSAIPLNSDLTDQLPYVSNNIIYNNTMDFGEGVYWITRYNGYFYSSGEIIKYDAVEYNISGFGNIWINSVQEYQNYFGKLPFNGKMYPTGRVRIYTEPNYEEVDGVLKLKNGSVAKHGRAQFGTTISNHYAGLNPYWSNNANVRGCDMQSKYLFETGHELPATTIGAAGVNNTRAIETTRNGIIKNFLSSRYIADATVNAMNSTQTGTIQSSALVMNGPSFKTTENPRDFISYVYKPLTDKYKHFGTRMRIIGKIENNVGRGQTPLGSSAYYVIPGYTPDQDLKIQGGSGGLAVMINPSTNVGYYFEIAALGINSIPQKQKGNVNNVMFYKIKKDSGSTSAIPVRLWQGLANIIVDDGKFTGQYRVTGEKNPTVYDLAVEYQDVGSLRRFYLYINNTLIATVDDTDPLPIYNNMAIFTRGSARTMFENIYALTSNYSQTNDYVLDTPAQALNSIFDTEINSNEAFRKYAMSGIVQGTYLSGISSYDTPKYSLYFDEFGTIMREAATFNIKYDKAYPALFAKLSPTFNRIKGYTVSGFRAGPYTAEFMIFNATDTALSLDETSGNYLRIQGVTFTQESNNSLTVDNYYSKNSDFSNPEFNGTTLVSSPIKVKKEYEDIKLSRMTYGKKDFALTVEYIQSQDDANELMKYLATKIMKPRRSIGLKIFAIPTIQLGDIVEIDYLKDGIDITGSQGKRFIVYNIEYSKSHQGTDMNIYVSEVA